MLSSMSMSPTIMYSGMIAATIGSILVLMKNISTSRVLLDRPQRQRERGRHGQQQHQNRGHDRGERGISTAADAAGEHRLVLRQGGEKTICGVLVYASASVLNAVSTIHSTGKNNTMPTTQANTPQSMPVRCGVWRAGPDGAAGGPGVGRGDVGAGHHAASSVPENEVKISRSANVAMMMVADDDDHAHGRGLADLEAQEGSLVDVERQVGAGDAGAALGHHVDRVEGR